MKPDIILGHGPFLGHTGYANHTRNFFTALSRLYRVRVFNSTYVDSIDYLKPEENRLLISQEFAGTLGKIGRPLGEYKNPLNIVLDVTNGSLYQKDFDGPKIAYNVWESTRQPEAFLEHLKTFDQLWVPSEWQKTVSLEQGYPADRIRVVPEGIDPHIFKPSSNKRKLNKFMFFTSYRWEYRKAMNEIVEAFVKEFGDNPDVLLFINADNPFPSDGLETTEQRLSNLGYNNPEKYGIIVLHFLPFDKYLKSLQNCDCFVSCSRAEGWNLPLLEAIACGVPTICSDYGAQLDFAKGISHTVDIVEHYPPKEVYGYPGICPGKWAEPDFDHLRAQMRNVYDNHQFCLVRAKLGSDEVRRKFTWENAALKAKKIIDEFDNKDAVLVSPEKDEDEKVIINNHFVNGAFLEVLHNGDKQFRCTLADNDTGTIEYENIIPGNNWIKSSKEYFINWFCEVRDENGPIYQSNFNAKNKKVFISFESAALGDTLAWIPYVEEFRKKHECQVVVSTFWNHILDTAYPDLIFKHPGNIEHDLYAMYRLKVKDADFNINKNDWRSIPLQKVACDILGLEYTEIRPKINKIPFLKSPGKRYVSISEASTAGCKQWQHPGAWQEVINYLNYNGYGVMVVSKESTELKNIIHQIDKPIETTIRNIMMSDFFIGVSSGLAWLAWALNKPVILISGCTQEWNEFQNCMRIINKDVCHGCMNDPKFIFDRGDWWWCPMKREMICTKSITPQMVIDSIKTVEGIVE